MIYRAPKVQNNFYVLDKKISEDDRLSWAARGLLVYILGKPDNWRISAAHLQMQTLNTAKPTKRDGIYSLLNELIEAGYVHRIESKVNGKFSGMNYYVSETPCADSPDTDYPHTALPDTAQTTLIRTDNKQELKEKTRTDISPIGSIEFALPDWINQEAWDLWIKTRKGKKMLPEQKQAQVAKLERWKNEGLDYQSSLLDSAANGWQGLFEPKQNIQKPQTGRQVTQLKTFAKQSEENMIDTAMRFVGNDMPTYNPDEIMKLGNLI